MSLSRRLSVGHLLNGVLLLLSLGLAATLLVSMLSAWQEASEARRVSALALANRTIFQATQDTRLSRANVQTALLGNADPQRRLAELRHTFTSTVDKTLTAIDLAVIPEGDDRARKVREAADGLTAAWPALDALAARPAAERAPNLYSESRYKAWYQTASNLVEAWDKLSHASLGASRIADPVIGELAAVQQYAWALRELSGNECQLMRAFVVAGEPLPADIRTRLDGMRGAAEASWAGLGAVLERPGAAPDLVKIAAAGKAAWRQSDAARDAVYGLQEAGMATPADSFGAMCTAPFGSFLAVINKAFDLMEAEASDRRTQARRRLALTAVALTVVLLLGAVIRREVRRRVIRPVRDLTAAIDALRDRDFTRPVPQVGRHDEFATMAETLEALRLGAREAEAMAAERANAQEAALQRAAGAARLCRDFEAVVVTTLETVGAATGKMSGSAEDMMATSRAALAEADDVAAAVQQTAGNIDKVAGAVGEMKASISEIAKKVAQSTRIAGEAVSNAELSNRDVGRLSAAANEIGAVVKLIGDIAAQTNLLALNATIEAARAGDAGKGFAVVANEVKSLATQTAKATEDITAQVAAMQGATRSAVDAIGDIGIRIRELDQIATLIAGAVEEQDSAMRQIARDAGEVAEVTTHVSARLGNLRDAAQRTGTAAETVRDNSGSLTSQAGTLSSQVVDFIEKLRQA